ncbi:hypothetical protein [Parapedobacter tibetensis]|uniref:hypothetical protein n=1 Tax=Parapedobacter tibetensis TaxID=2972951 RepID=UPI00214DBB33|nr:hypothetical protein [Parapedobacter tibetensis]
MAKVVGLHFFLTDVLDHLVAGGAIEVAAEGKAKFQVRGIFLEMNEYVLHRIGGLRLVAE